MFSCAYRDHDPSVVAYWQFMAIPRRSGNVELVREAEKWCEDQFGPRLLGGGPWLKSERWRIGGLSIFITDPTDATMFRLRWC